MIGPVLEIRNFLGLQWAHNLRRHAHDERAGRNAHPLRDQSVGTDDAAFSDDRAVQNCRTHADEAFVLDGAGVQNRAMTDGNIFSHDHWQIVREMNDRSILDVRPFADFDIIDVAAQNGGGPDAAAGGESHVADHDGVRRHIGGRVDLGMNKKKARALDRVHASIVTSLRFFVQFTLEFAINSSVNSAPFAKRALLGLFLLAWPALAAANIGDTLPELRERYGSAKDMGGQMLFEVRLVDGKIVPARDSANPEGHFTINVYFDGVHSAMELFARNTSDPAKAELSHADIDAILAATSNGQVWHPIQVPTGRATWVRNDNKLIARFSPNKSGKVDDASVLAIMLYTEK